MPCSDERVLSDDAWEREKRINELAKLLCSAGRAYWSKSEMPQEVLIWWKRHCEWDKSRGEPWDVEAE